MADQYTDRQRTRVVERDDLATRVDAAVALGQTQALVPQKKLFEGLSIPQIIAGAAAAATSVALASKIGIAGSVIGAAVSSIVTVVSSQLYRRALDASAEKLKSGIGADANPNAGASYAAGVRGGYAQVATASPDGNGYRRAGQTRIAPSKLRARTQRKVVAFSCAIALAAVVACAAAILIGTAGEGLGARTEPLFATAPVSDTAGTGEEDASAEPDGTSTAPASAQGGASDSGAADAGGTDASGTSGTDAGGTANGTADSNDAGDAATDGTDGTSDGESGSGTTAGNGSSTAGSGAVGGSESSATGGSNSANGASGTSGTSSSPNRSAS